MNTGLNKLTQQKMKDVFQLFPEIDRVILYGSRAKGNYRSSSDIDLVIQSNNLSHEKLNAIENQLDELYLPYKIDITLYNQIDNKNLLNHIDRVGIVLFQR